WQKRPPPHQKSPSSPAGTSTTPNIPPRWHSPGLAARTPASSVSPTGEPQSFPATSTTWPTATTFRSYTGAPAEKWHDRPPPANSSATSSTRQGSQTPTSAPTRSDYGAPTPTTRTPETSSAPPASSATEASTAPPKRSTSNGGHDDSPTPSRHHRKRPPGTVRRPLPDPAG